MAFDPKEHMVKVQNRDYLPVAWRLVWFREEHPDWCLDTKILEHEVGSYAVCETCVGDADGRLIARAQKMETVKGFAEYLEKAGTGSCGRALAMCGYGTQFDVSLEEGERIVDAPVQTKPTPQPAQPKQPANQPPDERAKLTTTIQADWKELAQFAPAFSFGDMKKASILEAAKAGVIATPAINAEGGKWVTTWLDCADINDLTAYGKYNRKQLNEARGKEANSDGANAD